jgi:hypothetical protein
MAGTSPLYSRDSSDGLEAKAGGSSPLIAGKIVSQNDLYAVAHPHLQGNEFITLSGVHPHYSRECKCSKSLVIRNIPTLQQGNSVYCLLRMPPAHPHYMTGKMREK